jgi:hypothetical protein
MRLMIVAVLMTVTGCGNYLNQTPSSPPATTPTPNPNDPACQIVSDQQHTPGYPFSLDAFKTSVLPTLTGTCAAAGCHAAPMGVGGFVQWADAAPGNCSYAKSFNALIKKVDLTNPTNSAVYVAITGGDPAHPVKLDKADAKVQALLDFITKAASNQTAPTPQAPPPPSANPFDYAVFQSTIEPILDNAAGKGCNNANCHGAAAGQAGFHLNGAPTAASPEMQANFDAITTRCNLTTPEQSKFYLQATTLHGSGKSAVLTTTEAATVLAWIKAAAATGATTGGGTGGTPSCPSPSNFNVDVFHTNIEPILLGTLDLNNRGSTLTSGCARSACHGADRTGGALVIKTSNTSAQNLQNFACFVNIANPTASAILECPLNAPGCPKSPHPGQNVFLPGNTDLNYQRILSFLYATKTASTPLDFAFFARQINPIFSDVNSVQNGAQGRSCTDSQCHGITAPGQPAPNGSALGILGNAGDPVGLQYNFATASNFTNFIKPSGSSLFLFPTNEIANLANPFATGLAHPGGLDFAVGSTQANAILAWANGLRPDGVGNNLNWLVAGVYAASQITDLTSIDEVNVTPQIFDNDGALQFNAGVWDGLFSPVAKLDLAAEFPQAANSGRIAYAVAYVLNTTPADIQAQITVVSDNVIKLYVGKNPVLQTANAGGDGAPAFATLPAFANSKSTTRLLLKVFQRAADVNFNFQVKFQDQFGNPLTNTTGELVFLLGPGGGI